ncbi:MAG: class I SAM-dependent methyltransferase [Leptolyngbyaceae cyanobacterium MO_188.B28]|nr:class I SAM-dependent methyltransferase [Leptolyngbyaceae cyanobacterium MO_188.B28]
MTVFGAYAKYYDLLYRDKDYQGEGQFIIKLLRKHAPNAKRLLELGSGTGRHAEILAQAGYHLHGIERSPDMLAQCHAWCAQLPAQQQNLLQFTEGDLRSIRLGQQFDVVISLFHVVSYQTTNTDLRAAFSTVKEHLKPGGVFIFDVWYGPAVLSEQPTVRVKRLTDGMTNIARIAEPNLNPNDNLVEVNYQVFIQNTQDEIFEEIRESHRMRYLFKPEIDFLLESLDMELVTSGGWMTDQPAGLDTWSVYFLVKRK